MAELDVEYLGVDKIGTHLEFSLSNISQIEAVVGPLQVSVKHRDDEATLPYEILVGTELSIIDVTPNNGGASDKIEIKGIGFSNKIADNIVTFSGENGVRLTAQIEDATTTALTVAVPSGVQTGFITVEVNDELSNEFDFFLLIQLLITFGDNGNLKDDVYKLSVNGNVLYDNSSPQRKIGPVSVSLDEGEHLVELTGIRADDGIGTYYIEFAGDVASVTGDAQSGRDLCPNTIKAYYVTIASNSTTKIKPALSNKQLVLQAESDESQTECTNF